MKRLAPVFVVVLAVTLCACGATIRDNIRTAALVTGTVALDVDKTERDLYATGIYDAATHKAIGAKILVMLESCQAFERAAKVWPETLSMPPDVPTAMAKALQSIADVKAIVSPLPGTSKLITNLDKLSTAIGGK